MFDYLVDRIHESVSQIEDHRTIHPTYELRSVIMSAFAMFSLKDPSLLSFVENYETRQENLKSIYKIEQIPTDNGIRNILDPVAPNNFLPVFKSILSDERVEPILENHQCFNSLGGYTAIAVDGTGCFSSNCQGCPHCLIKNRKNGTEYYHQLAGACIVNPNEKTVFPVFAEPITRQDGSTKNDCEYNAFKRLVPHLAQLLPTANKLILLDGLFATGPAIRLMYFYQMDYITVIKEGYVLIQVEQLARKKELAKRTWYQGKNKEIKCTAQWYNGLILNGANQDIEVNYLEYKELDTRSAKIKYRSKWITSLDIEPSMVKEFVKIARSRWKIENETFNVLKNHGYNLEHNYGHGKKFLASCLATIMFLAFLVDQLTQCVDKTCRKAISKAKTLRDFRQKVRVLFDFIPCVSMNLLYRIIARDIQIGLSP